MGLRNANQTASTAPAFEDEEGTAAAPAAESAPADVPTAPTLRANAALAVPKGEGEMYAVRDLRNQLRVDYNTLAQVQATQGSFIDRETEEVLGDEVVIELLSWQDSYVCSPNDDAAPKELVKYSEDGITTKDGTSMADHLASLKDDGYAKAKITHRVVLVGALKSANKGENLVGELVQIDLPPTGKAQFDRYVANCAWKIRSGALSAEASKTVKLTASIAKGQGSVKYTLVRFG